MAFNGLCAGVSRPSFPPKKLLQALLLQVLFSLRSERMLLKQLSSNLLCRWFVRLSMDEPVEDASTFSKNRGRPFSGKVGLAFFAEAMAMAQ